MNSWKSFIATACGDANHLDAAADTMDSPALLRVAFAKLKTVPNNTQEVDTEEEDDTQNWIFQNLFYGQMCLNQ